MAQDIQVHRCRGISFDLISLKFSAFDGYLTSIMSPTNNNNNTEDDDGKLRKPSPCDKNRRMQSHEKNKNHFNLLSRIAAIRSFAYSLPGFRDINGRSICPYIAIKACTDFIKLMECREHFANMRMKLKTNGKYTTSRLSDRVYSKFCT